jgi:hypothetical protein
VPARRAARHVLLLALAALLVARGGAGAVDAKRTKCLKNARSARNECAREATERCNDNFDTELRGCFGEGNTCVRGCIGDRERCLVEPQTSQEGCRIACGADLKVALGQCKVQVDQKACQQTAREKALTCKQHCTGQHSPAKQRCVQAFNDCLNNCAG